MICLCNCLKFQLTYKIATKDKALTWCLELTKKGRSPGRAEQETPTPTGCGSGDRRLPTQLPGKKTEDNSQSSRQPSLCLSSACRVSCGKGKLTKGINQVRAKGPTGQGSPSISPNDFRHALASHTLCPEAPHFPFALT